MTRSVRTVLGDIEPDALGVTYAHEHVILDSPFVEDRLPDIRLDSVAAAVAELRSCAAVGVSAMVDALPCATGRDVLRLAQVSRASGVHIVAATGLHSETWYPGTSWANEAAPEILADLFTADVVDGIDRFDYRGPVIDRTDHRAGIVKIGSLHDVPNERDRRVFAAAVETQRRTGAPIITHCEGGRGAVAQVELLSEYGADLGRVVLSHTDKVADLAYHADILETGINVEYDQALRQPVLMERGTAWVCAGMVAAGYVDQIMLGTDGARRSMWTTLGGAPGLAWLASGLVAMLEARGVEAADVQTMLVANPARVLALGGSR